ncbi:TauD/TfdA dioxygenase family protein [Dactylosporangium sp. McL0621]|uniref:TauD/TfdA dioxygenase family protein n=1 Tax=Dactylosporangium sp. McL0621 TaxID=3415678 RepID=UPI003CEABE7B
MSGPRRLTAAPRPARNPAVAGRHPVPSSPEPYAHLAKPEHIVRHRRRAGDVAMWDNRSTAHYANRDYGPAHRVMHRITLRGDVPRGVS